MLLKSIASDGCCNITVEPVGKYNYFVLKLHADEANGQYNAK